MTEVILGPGRTRLSMRPLRDYRNVVILTGAGISVASGLPTFRGAGGLWEDDPALAANHHVSALPGSAAVLWRTWGPVRAQLPHLRPSAAHLAIAQYAEAVEGSGGSCTVVTQNVDGLHQRAGSREVAELHGNLAATRCSNPECDLPPYPDPIVPDGVPACPRCSAPLIPDVVLFGESPDLDAQWLTKSALRTCDLFLAVGTSGSVAPASGYVRYAYDVGARTILVNLTPPDVPHPHFDEVHVAAADDYLPGLLGE